MTRSPSERPPERLGEFALIAELFAPLAKDAPGAFGLLDDAATIAPPPGHELVITVDAVVEGVHFLAEDPPDLIAKKALRVNLSDLAAKGATPAGYLLAFIVPETKSMEWMRGFARGLAEDQKEFGIPLLGGDTASTSGPLTLSITAFGFVPRGRMIRRAGAKPGDLVFVSGTIGDAGGGLAILKGAPATPRSAEVVRRYRVPEPRMALGPRLLDAATACLDVSDGLLADLGHIADVSKVHIALDAPRIPRSAALRELWGEGADAILKAATAGDDYELAFTAPPEKREAVFAAGASAGVAVTEIGRVESGEGLELRDEAGHALDIAKAGWTHF
jgi:thiamine-monophosphate kinase